MSAQPGTTYGTRFIFTETGCALYSGTVDPEGAQTGNIGDVYFRVGATAGIYLKRWGTGNIGWSLMTYSPIFSASVSPSVSPSVSISSSPSKSESSSPSVTASSSPSVSPSLSPSSSPSVSPSWGDTGYGAVKFTDDANAFRNEVDTAPSATAFTVMFWVRLDSSVTTDEWRLFFELSEYDGGIPQGAYWFIGAKNDYVQFQVWKGSDETSDSYDLPSTFTLGDWHHLALVTDGSNHRCYLDGTLVDTLVLTFDSIPGGAGNTWERIGSDGLTATHNNFSIAEFRRWSVALTTGEVQTEMASHNAVKTSNIFRDLTLGNISGTDVSGQGNDMDIISSTGMVAVTGPRGSRSPSASPSTSESVSPSSSASSSPSSSPS